MNEVSETSPDIVLRTPDERFSGLPGYGFAPHYVELAGSPPVRMHYVDEGPRDGRPVLLLHGEPTWSYLYRKMIPQLAAAGMRAIAPDLIGVGRSDKLARRASYTYAGHVAWLQAFVRAIDLQGAVLFVQDWGGLLGLRLLAQDSARFSAVVAANTFLPTGDDPPSPAFYIWRQMSQVMDPLLCSRIVAGTCVTKPTPAEAAGYDAPFPGEPYLAAARDFPMLVPDAPDNVASAPNRAAWAALATFEKPFFTAFSDGDPVTRGLERVFHARVPGAAGRAHVTVRGAGHFLQEEKPDELVAVILASAQAVRSTHAEVAR